MISIGTIRTNLKGVISNLINQSVIAVVHDYYKPDLGNQYPAVVFDITSNTDDYLTNKENLLKITFTAYLIVEIIVDGIEDATRRLDTVTDALIVELRKESNLSLSSSVDWVSPAIGPRTQIETTNGQAFSQQLDIQINVADTI